MHTGAAVQLTSVPGQDSNSTDLHRAISEGQLDSNSTDLHRAISEGQLDSTVHNTTGLPSCKCYFFVVLCNACCKPKIIKH